MPEGHGELRKLGKRDGIRWAITWLHRQAESMNDPKAKAILNSAAFGLGNEIREGHIPPVPDSAADMPIECQKQQDDIDRLTQELADARRSAEALRDEVAQQSIDLADANGLIANHEDATHPSADDIAQARQLLTRISDCALCSELCRLPPCQCINDVAAALTAARREGQELRALDEDVVEAGIRVFDELQRDGEVSAEAQDDMVVALAARDAAKLNEVPRFCSETPPPLPPGGGRGQGLPALDEDDRDIALYCGDCTTPNKCQFGRCKDGKPIGRPKPPEPVTVPPGEDPWALDEAVIDAARAYCASYNSLGRLDSSLLHAMDRALAARDAAIMRTEGPPRTHAD